jgi:hypothetical protein
MVYVVQSYWACFGLYPSSCMWKTKNTTTFRKLDLSPSSGGWGRINLLSWARLSCPIHLRTEADPVSETLWYCLSSTYKTMDKVQNKPNSSVQHTPSSESFQVYLIALWHVDPLLDNDREISNYIAK